MLGIVPVSLRYFVTSMRDYEVLKTGYLSIISRILFSFLSRSLATSIILDLKSTLIFKALTNLHVSRSKFYMVMILLVW